jgi:SET domain-containing protein
MARKSYTPGNFDLVVKRSKSGLGLFVGEDETIPKGACVIEYVGPVVPKGEEDNINSLYLFEVNARKTINGAPRYNTARYINHSCKANCEPNIHKGRVFIHALRRIKPGEELNYDYGENYFKEYLKDVCACPKCEAKRVKPAKTRAAAASRTRAKTKTAKAKTKTKKTKKRA